MAYNGNTLVGAREWVGAYTDIPAMGYMDESTENYCRPGDIPRFVIEKSLTGEIIELDGTIPAWENNMLFNMILSPSETYIPNEYEVSVAYPNPFNPVTSIDFGIPKDEMVSVKVYDINGKVVAELMNDYKTAGYYNVQWNANNQSSGLYFVQLTTQGYQSTQKVMLVK